MKNKPELPKEYRFPSGVTVEVIKKPFKKGYWLVTVLGEGVLRASTKDDAYKYLINRLQKPYWNDQQIFEDLYRRCASAVLHEFDFKIDGNFYQSITTKDEYYPIEQVNLLRWYIQNNFKMKESK